MVTKHILRAFKKENIAEIFLKRDKEQHMHIIIVSGKSDDDADIKLP